MIARLATIVGGFGVLAAALLIGVSHGAAWSGVLLSWLDRLRGMGAAGAGLFVALQALVALIGFLPASLLGLAAGAVYGIGMGFGLSATGLMIGAGLAFGLARSALRSTIIRLVARRDGLRRFDAALARDGWRLVLLMRVSPVMPFSLTSFALGLSGIQFRDYAVGTLASLPALALYVTLGRLGVSGIAAIGRGDGAVHLAVLGIGLVATGLLTLRIGQLVGRAWGVEGKASR